MVVAVAVAGAVAVAVAVAVAGVVAVLQSTRSHRNPTVRTQLGLRYQPS